MCMKTIALLDSNRMLAKMRSSHYRLCNYTSRSLFFLHPVVSWFCYSIHAWVIDDLKNVICGKLGILTPDLADKTFEGYDSECFRLWISDANQGKQEHSLMACPLLCYEKKLPGGQVRPSCSKDTNEATSLITFIDLRPEKKMSGSLKILVSYPVKLWALPEMADSTKILTLTSWEQSKFDGFRRGNCVWIDHIENAYKFSFEDFNRNSTR